MARTSISFVRAARAHFSSRRLGFEIQAQTKADSIEPVLEVVIRPRDVEIARETQEVRSFDFEIKPWKSTMEIFGDLCNRIEAAIASMQPKVAFAEARRAQGRLVRLYGYEVTAVALDAVMTMAQYRPLADDMEN